MMLAHGGTAGAVAEVAFIIVPVAIFWFLSRWAKRRAAAEGSPAAAPETVAPETGGPSSAGNGSD